MEKEINPPEEQPEDVVTQANYAWRMVVDLVAGVGVGFATGYGLDVFFGTRPLIMIVLTLLGFGAGINLMLKTAKELKQQGDNQK